MVGRERFVPATGSDAENVRLILAKSWWHAFRKEGFAVEFAVEPEFGEQECTYLRGGREHQGIRTRPRRAGDSSVGIHTERARSRQLANQRILSRSRQRGSLWIRTRQWKQRLKRGRVAIESIRSSDRSESRTNPRPRSHGYLLLPGLINAHDHLEFALFPRLGNRTYANAHEWALDIYRPEDDPIRSLRKIEKSIRLWWGGIRNLLSGVTTVCHHNEYAPAFDDHFPVRVLRNYGWAHSFAFEEKIQSRAQRVFD